MKRTASAVAPKFALLIAAFSISACTAGGGNEQGPLPSGVPAGPAGASPSSQARFVITVPAKTTASTSRRPQYVSPSTQSLTISVDGGTPVTQNLTPASPNCSTSAGGLECTATIAAPVGSDTFTVTTYDRTGGAGHVLSTAGTGAIAIVPGTAATVPIILAGVVATIALALNPKSLTTGTHAAAQLTVTAKDADGNTIVGPGGYENAIALAKSGDTASEITLSASSLPGPTAPITVTFNGGAVAETVTLTGSATGATSGSATLAISAPQFMYVISYTDPLNGVAVFPAGASGNVAPVRTITTTSPGSSVLFGPFDAVDSAGNLYADEFNNQGNPQAIYVYHPNVNGNLSPDRVINYVAPGGVRGVFSPNGLAIDNVNNELYVYDFNVPGIEVFDLGTKGNSTPKREISGSNTNIDPVGNNPAGIAFDPVTGDLYVEARSGILVFPRGANGNVMPAKTVTYSNYAEIGLAVGPLTEDLFESTGYNAINVFPKSPTPAATPLRQIAGSNVPIASAGGIAVDNQENLYVADAAEVGFAPCLFGGVNYRGIFIWGSTANGNVAPNRYVCGPNTGFVGAEGVAIGP
jgi:hypothetical protein